MTKKHFKKLAEAIKTANDNIDQGDPQAVRILTELTSDIADVCQQSNELFDRGRFLKACGF